MLRKHKLLVVDDDPVNIEILQEILEEDYDVVIAKSGEEALEAIPDCNPKLILLDVMMPGIDGYDVCKKIKTDKNLSDIGIFLISAKAMPDELEQGYEVGADEYITKPFDHDELCSQIKNFFH